jgi:hypothetical protein
MNAHELRGEYDRLTKEGARLAGRLADVPQRAAVYHHVFFDSGRNHVFPLIAAHGALWARGYFSFGLRLAEWLSWQYALDAALRRRQLAAVTTFADTLRDINRRVCADTYASYHFTAQYGKHPDAAEIVAPELLDSLLRVHTAREAGRELSDGEKLSVFSAHFFNEQEHVVGPTIAEAIAELRWPLVRLIALKPAIRFAYFPRGERLWFADFSNRDERITNGLRAFDLAAQAGWQTTAGAMRDYAILPDEFFADVRSHFAGLRESVLAGA